MTTKRRKGFRFEVKVEKNTIPYDLAQQTLSFDHNDRDIAYFTGNLEQKKLFDDLCEEYAADIRKEKVMMRRSRKLHR